MTSAGPNLSWRIAGLVALALIVTAVVATIAFPIVAGVMRFGMPPGTTGFRSLMLWAGYAFGDKGQPAHWFAIWTNLSASSSMTHAGRSAS